MEHLQRLTADRSTIVLPSSFRSGADASLDTFDSTIEAFERPVDLTHARGVIAEAMKRFSRADRTTGDGWLAARLHAALRLTPREAADPAIWHFLAIKAFPDYVVWRWKDEEDDVVPVNRYLGDINKQALSRLWWGAELTRNGPDYTTTAEIFRVADYPNSWHFRLFRHRPMAIAVSRIAIESFGVNNHTRRARDLLKAANTGLVSNVLDAIAPYPGADPEAIRDWVRDSVEYAAILDDGPTGPDEDQVTSDLLAGADAFLRRIAKANPFLRPLVDPEAAAAAASDGPSDFEATA